MVRKYTYNPKKAVPTPDTEKSGHAYLKTKKPRKAYAEISATNSRNGNEETETHTTRQNQHGNRNNQKRRRGGPYK